MAEITTAVKAGKKRGEYRKVNLAISLTMIIWFITGMLYAYTVEPGMTRVIVAVTVLGTLMIAALALYARIKRVKGGDEYMDERSDVCSMKATRNAFIFTLAALAVYMIIGQLRPDSLYRIQALQGVFGVSVAAYVLSYFYYLQVNQGA